jgi:hypothetical protein
MEVDRRNRERDLFVNATDERYDIMDGRKLVRGNLVEHAMPSPFPGMDPYLESPEIWRDVHSNLITASQESLNRLLRPNYVARIELRVYLSDEDDPGRAAIIPDVRIEKRNGPAQQSPKSRSNGGSSVAIVEPMPMTILIDEEIEEARLEITHVKSKSLVTVIEIMSPTNKIRGAEGRKSFLKKRREILASEVNWVEIDLLRAGTPSQPMRVGSDYRVLVAKGTGLGDGRFWPISVRQPLPMIDVPLRAPDKDVPLELGAILNAAYDRAAYDLSIDYGKHPDPPLSKDDAKWADKLLRQKHLR